MRRREKKRKRTRWSRRIIEKERERRRLGDVRTELLTFVLDGRRLASRFVFINSQSCKLVWVAMKTRKDALMAAPL